jgi:uncharacterized protein YndB with AHSA1/START domain
MKNSSDQPYLRFKRRFSVPPETVFNMLTDPERMRIWWGDDAEFDIDLRVRGQWKIIRWEGGEKYIATGSFLKVERPSRLQYTFAMLQFSPNSDTITIQIEEDNGGSIVTFEQAGEDIATELRDLPQGETSSTEEGWQQGFDLMAVAWS